MADEKKPNAQPELPEPITPEEMKSMTPDMMAKRDFPKAAFFLVAIGGLLIFVEGLVSIFFRSLYWWYEIDFLAGLGQVVIGILLIIDGWIVAGGAITFLLRPKFAKAAAVSVILFSLLALLFGGGWYIGSIMGFIGAILAMMWKPKADAGSAQKPSS